MIRILIHTDTPCLCSGLARCGRELAKRFSETTEIIDTKPTKKFELAYAAWHHQPKRHEFPYFIYSLGKGIPREADELKNILDDFKPDVLFSIGDIWNFSKITDTIYNYKETRVMKWLLWLTVDGENWHPAWKRTLNLADEICVFSEFGKTEVKKLLDYEPEVVYPGVDKTTFRRISVDFKTKDSKLPLDLKNTFIVLNVNQNTDRKNIPLTLEAFVDFAKDKDDVFLLLATDPDDPYGFDLWQLIEKLDIKKKVAITKEAGPRKGMSDERLNLLYNLSAVSVNTSIGEGLSLPALEAMAVGLPVIATDYASVSELIDKGGGFKIDIAAYIWGFNGIRRAIASKSDLVKKLDVLYNDFKTDKALRTEIAKKSMAFTDSLSWENSAQKFMDKVELVVQKTEESLPFIKTRVKVDNINPLVIIPSWGKNCGIAEYTKSLLEAMARQHQSVTVFPSYSFKEVPKLIQDTKCNLVEIQHEFSFFRSKTEFEELLQNLNKLKVKIVLTMHSLVPNLTSLNDLMLMNCDDIIVHSKRFKDILEERLKVMPDIRSRNMCNIEVIEMGCSDLFQVDEIERIQIKKNLNLDDKYPIIASFGFLREQKGYYDLLSTMKELKKIYKKAFLLIIAPPHEFGSKVYDEMFYNFVIKQGLENDILIIREYLKEDKLLKVLQCADAFVLNYIDSPYGGGVSAAVKTLFRVQKPILVREGIAFADLINGEVLKIRGGDINVLVDAIKTLIEDKEMAMALVKNANDFVIRNNWENVAEKHIDLYNR